MSDPLEVNELTEENTSPHSQHAPLRRGLRRRSSEKFSTNAVNITSSSQEASLSADADLLDLAASICNKRKSLLNKARKSENVTKVLPRTCNSHSHDASWEERDRQRLLVALQRFGVLNMKELLKAVPGKNEEQIKTFIQSKWRAARMHLREGMKKNCKNEFLGPIDKWLELLNGKFPSLDVYKANPLARAVLFIWKFEVHPDPKDCGGVDFKAAYEYLYYMLRGFPPRELNQPTATFVSDSLSNFAFNIKHQSWTEEKDYLKNTPLKLKCPTRETKSDDDVIAALSFSEEQSFDELLKLPGFNPFDIPLRYLKRKGPIPFNDNAPSSSSSNDNNQNEDNCPGDVG